MKELFPYQKIKGQELKRLHFGHLWFRWSSLIVVILFLSFALFYPLSTMGGTEDGDALAFEMEDVIDGDEDWEDEEDWEAEDGELSNATSRKPNVVAQSQADEELLRELEGVEGEGVSSRKLQNETVVVIQNEVTDLRFKMVNGISRIAIDFRHRPRFQEVKNAQTNQVIYLFENTETPSRLQRAYDTSEFTSPVGLFTLLQMPNQTPPLSKLIVQLREGIPAKAILTPKGIHIEFPPPTIMPIIKKDGEDDADSGLAVEENIYDPEKVFTGKAIERLEIKNTSVQDVLRLIAQSSGYNIVVGEDVKGNIGTISLRDVPWDQAFTMVLQSKKLGYIKQGNVLRIGTLKGLKAEKEAALAAAKSRRQVEPLRTLLIPISYAKASDIVARAKSFLSERGMVDTDDRTNMVIVKDISENLKRIQKLFKALDTQPPRVAIAAKIVEIVSSFNKGIGFSAFKGSGSFAGINVTEGKFATDFSAPAGSITLSAPEFANLEASFLVGQVEDKVKILANPSVSAVANQEAKISQSLSFFTAETISVPGVGNVTEIKQKTATLSLGVTPIVAGDGSIFMTVSIKNEIPRVAENTTQIDTREISTQVLVENGDTAVIGGIFNSTINTSRSGIPFFMDIPILSFFVSNESIQNTRNELLVFLTPKVTNAEAAFKRSL